MRYMRTPSIKVTTHAVAKGPMEFLSLKQEPPGLWNLHTKMIYIPKAKETSPKAEWTPTITVNVLKEGLPRILAPDGNITRATDRTLRITAAKVKYPCNPYLNLLTYMTPISRAAKIPNCANRLTVPDMDP